MKTIVLLLAVLIIASPSVSLAQETADETESETTFYSVFVNIVPDNFNLPLIGFVNIAKGNQQNPQIGFVNLNQKDLSGIQLGYVNLVGGGLSGFQGGFVNAVQESVSGAQLGFVNATTDRIHGMQWGFVNTASKATNGIQLGYVNNTGDLNGFGIGFVNVAQKLNGFQLGFVNYVDSLENGMPVGFLSIVRKGGYKAFELSANELYPLNLDFKIGVSRFYTIFSMSYNEKFEDKLASGFGIGTIIPISDRSFINPEYKTYSSSFFDVEISEKSFYGGFNFIDSDFYKLSQLAINYGYNIDDRFSLLAGPTISWNYADTSTSFKEPVFALYENEINKRNKINIGLSLRLRYAF